MMPSLELQLDILLGSTALLGIGWLAAGMLSRASAGARHLAWSAAVVGVLALPLAHWLVPTVPVEALPALEIGSWHVSPAGVVRSPASPALDGRAVMGSGGRLDLVRGSRDTPVSLPVREIPDAYVGREATHHAQALPGTDRVRSVTALVWITGAALVLCLVGLERWRLRRLRRGSRRVTSGPLRERTDALAERLGVRRRVSIHICPSAVIPMTWGSLGPVLLLPSGAEQWSDLQLQPVLLHELAHVRRRDVLTQTLAAAACVFYWFNPLVWLAAHRMREERERAADDLVLDTGLPGPAYAESLVAMTRSLRGAPTGLTAVSMARASSLAGRVDAILDESLTRGQPGSTTVGGTLTASLAAVALLTAFAPAASSPDEPGLGRDTSVLGRAAPAAAGTSPSEAPRQALGVDTLPACWRGDSNRRLSVDATEGSREVVRQDDRCRATIRITGRVEFDAAYSDIVGVSPGGHVLIEERDASGSRRFEVRGDPDGTPVYEVRLDDGSPLTGVEAGAAFSTRLLVLFRYGGVASTARASWMLDADGLDRVLAEARAIPPDPVAADYLLVALGAVPGPSPDALAEIGEIVREQVGSDMHAGHVLATLLVGHPEVASSPARDAVARAMASVGSDVAQVDMLIAALESNGGPELDAMLLQSARAEIGSDAAMAGFLSEYARRRPRAPVGDRLAADFWRAVATVGSDGEHARLLRGLAAPPGDESALLVRALASAADEIGSDGILATYLQWTVDSSADALSDAGARRAFRDALDAIGSDRMRRRVVTTVRGAGLDHLLDT